MTGAGEFLDRVIKNLPERLGVKIEKYIIMPNHFHMIVVIEDSEALRAIRESPLQKRSVISKVMGYIKMNSSKQIREKMGNIPVWQRSFHDHVIRDEKDYLKIWEYIEHKAQKWEADCFYCE